MINKETYKRFTRKDKYGHWYTDTKINDRFMWSTNGKVWERDLTHCAFDGKAIDRLAELEDKIMDGTLIELPCKIGDTATAIIDTLLYDNSIQKVKIKGIAYIVEDENGDLTFQHISRVFLTKAEAEAKLKELQENKK